MERIRKIYEGKNCTLKREENIQMCNIRSELDRIQNNIDDFLFHVGDGKGLLSKMCFLENEDGRQNREQLLYLAKEMTMVSQIIHWLNAIIGATGTLNIVTDLNGKSILLFDDAKQLAPDYCIDVLCADVWRTVQIIMEKGNFQGVDLYDEDVVIETLDGLPARRRTIF